MSVTFRFRNSGDAMEYLFYDRYGFSGKFKLGLNIGCNDGLSTLSLSRFCDRVVSFEPNVASFRLAQQNLSPFGHEVQNVGFWDQPALRRADLLSIHGGVGTIEEEGTDQRYIRGDELGLSPDVMKIDAYFDAHRVLGGFAETLQRCTPTLFIATYRPWHQEPWVSKLAGIGYSVTEVREKAVTLHVPR